MEQNINVIISIFFNFLFFIIKNNKTKRNMFDILQIFAKIDNINVY